MNTRTNDARGFVDSVVRHLQYSKDSQPHSLEKVRSLLYKMSKKAHSERTARVDSTVPWTQSQKMRLQNCITAFSGQTVELEFGIDPELIGGFRIQMGDWIVDTSLAKQIDEMAGSLL